MTFIFHVKQEDLIVLICWEEPLPFYSGEETHLLDYAIGCGSSATIY